jgi:hypothetical protein
MRTYCCVCGAEIELPLEEFLDEDKGIDDYFCDACVEEAREFAIKLNLSKN